MLAAVVAAEKPAEPQAQALQIEHQVQGQAFLHKPTIPLTTLAPNTATSVIMAIKGPRPPIPKEVLA